MPRPKLTPVQRRLKAALTDAVSCLSSAETILWPYHTNPTIAVDSAKIGELRRELEGHAATIHERS